MPRCVRENFKEFEMFRRNSFPRQELVYCTLLRFPSPLPCLFAIAVRANVSSNDSRGSILDEPLLFPNLYSPVKCFRKQFSNFSLAFYNHSLFHQFPLIPFFEKKRKEGRKEELANLFFSPTFSTLGKLRNVAMIFLEGFCSV